MSNVGKVFNLTNGSGGLKKELAAHIGNRNNPHGLTAGQVGADPAGTAEAKANVVQQNLNTHTSNKQNPHGVSKAQVGLGNVDNTSDVNKPISTAVQNALNGKANSSHTHTKSQITDFPTSMPASDVSAWAKASSKPKYTASEVGAVPTSRTVNGKALSSNISLSASDVGAAPTSHNHSAANITSGILSVARGGTGVSSLSALASALGMGSGFEKIMNFTASQNVKSSIVEASKPFSDYAVLIFIFGNIRQVDDYTHVVFRAYVTESSSKLSTDGLTLVSEDNTPGNSETPNSAGCIVFNPKTTSANSVSLYFGIDSDPSVVEMDNGPVYKGSKWIFLDPVRNIASGMTIEVWGMKR